MTGSGSAWRLPGYEVLELLGFGASGEVWRAREQASGELVALKRLREDAGPAVLAALQREAAVLRVLGTAHVVRLRAVVGGVLVLDHADGGSLAGLLLARGRLAPGEVVTLAVPLAEALAAAHARGLVHGDVSPAGVLLTGDGRPLLSDLGLARLLNAPGRSCGTPGYADPAALAGAPPSPAGDVRALAAVVHHALCGSPPGEAREPLGLLAPPVLVRAVEAALADDPAARPDAAALALALRGSCDAVPVRLPAPVVARAPEPARQEREARPRRQVPRWAPAVAALLLLAAAAGLGWRLGATAPPVAAAPPGPADWGPAQWAAVLDDLDAERSRAWAAGDPAALLRTYAPGSAALRADRQALQRLVDSGRLVRGLRHRVEAVAPVSVTPGSARLRVRDVLPAHAVVAADGTVLEQRPARPAADLEVELRRTPAGWRLAGLRPL